MKKLLIAMALVFYTTSASAEEVVKENKCQIRLVKGNSLTAEIYINEYLAQGYDLIKISKVKCFTQFIFAKNCDNQIRIHSDFIMKEEKE